MEGVRPTLRCLRDDLRLPVPPSDEPLDQVSHPLLTKANEQFADDATPRERIVAVDDQILLKVKIQRWRGAVWREVDGTKVWLVAAGRRESGSPEDFYAALAAAGRAARKRYNAMHKPMLRTDTYTVDLLPQDDDRLRYKAEAGARLDRLLTHSVRQLVRQSLRDGHEHAAEFSTFMLGVHVRADDGHETYVAVRVFGSVPMGLVISVLEVVPGCDPAQWEYSDRMPSRALRPGEEAYLNLMNPSEAARLLEAD